MDFNKSLFLYNFNKTEANFKQTAIKTIKMWNNKDSVNGSREQTHQQQQCYWNLDVT